MKRFHMLVSMLCAALAVCVACVVSGCGGSQPASDGAVQEEVAATAEDASATPALADGSYQIEVDTDSSMFHADSCTLTVEDSSYTAELVLPGEGFSRLYFGTAEEAAQAPDVEIFDYHLNDEGKYSFTLPVETLDEDLTIAAFGQRRDTWYDHTICFKTPANDALADAA